MSGTEIDYFALTQDAMRGIVRGVLRRVAQYGLPGEHHFYISFRTGHPGVNLSKRLRERYPNEMTIVLQHRFSNLLVQEDRFEVTLSFESIPERLTVPFAALKAFFDPYARFAHQFEPIELAAMPAERPSLVSETSETAPESEAPPTMPVRRPRAKVEEKKGEERKPEEKRRKPTALVPTAPVKSPAVVPRKPVEPAGAAPTSRPAEPQRQDNERGKVVELDAFRKKPS
jgi:hypothetical protein